MHREILLGTVTLSIEQETNVAKRINALFERVTTSRYQNSCNNRFVLHACLGKEQSEVQTGKNCYHKRNLERNTSAARIT